MKVRTINPGGVYRRPEYPDQWTYFMLYDGVKMFTMDSFPTAELAKQALIEKVVQQREQYGILGVGNGIR